MNIVYGCNHELYTDDMQIVTAASCTTNCIAPVIKVRVSAPEKCPPSPRGPRHHRDPFEYQHSDGRGAAPSVVFYRNS